VVPQRNLDIVFIDAIKTEYPAYLDAVVPLLKRSGLSWSTTSCGGGAPLRARGSSDDADTVALRAFSRNVPELP